MTHKDFSPMDRKGMCQGGLGEVSYVHQDFLPGMKKCYLNDFRCLHDPALFGLSKTGVSATTEKSEAEQ